MVAKSNLHELVYFVVVKVALADSTRAIALMCDQLIFVRELLGTLEGTLEQFTLIMFVQRLFGREFAIAVVTLEQPFVGLFAMLSHALGQNLVSVGVHCGG